MHLKFILLLGIHHIVCQVAYGQIQEVKAPPFENLNLTKLESDEFTSKESLSNEANKSKTILEPIEKQNITKISNEVNENFKKINISKGLQVDSRKIGSDTDPQAQQKWKVMAQTVVKDFEKDKTRSVVEAKADDSEKEFKPSPELGTYYDLDNFRNPLVHKINYQKYFAPIDVRKSPTSLNGDSYNEKDKYYKPKHTKVTKILNQNKRPQEEREYEYQKDKIKNSFKSHPYEFYVPKHGSYTSRNIKGKQQDSKPTIESVVAIPAGGLYQLPHPLYAIQNEYQEVLNEEMEHEYGQRPYIEESKERKKPNPWKNVVGLLTTILPIGLLISALTPSVITVDSAVTGGSPLSRRRSEDDGNVSYTCMRRLLCELQNSDILKHDTMNRSIYAGTATPNSMIKTPGLSTSSLATSQNCSQYKCDDPTLFTGSLNKGRHSTSDVLI